MNTHRTPSPTKGERLAQKSDAEKIVQKGLKVMKEFLDKKVSWHSYFQIAENHEYKSDIMISIFLSLANKHMNMLRAWHHIKFFRKPISTLLLLITIKKHLTAVEEVCLSLYERTGDTGFLAAISDSDSSFKSLIPELEYRRRTFLESKSGD